jgi:hypothetical protein
LKFVFFAFIRSLEHKICTKGGQQAIERIEIGGEIVRENEKWAGLG